MPRKGIFFFATKNDMQAGLRLLEENQKFKYVLTGLFDSKDIHSYSSYSDIPNFGVSLLGDKVHQPTYMILNIDQEVNIREIPQRRGGIKYAIDGVKNDPLLFFTPSGEYKHECLIPGEFSPTDTEASLAMYSQFRKLFTRNFSVIQSYRVGPEAEKLLDSDIPLTPNRKADPIMYLKR